MAVSDASGGNDQSADGAVRFTRALNPVAKTRASDSLAEQLRDAILTGELEAGVRLPSMQELADQTGLGRSTVREALKVLEAEGLLHMRYGRNGGPHVLGPGSQALVRTVDVFVRRRKVLYSTLLETREALEPQCAFWAATRRTDEDLEVLRNLHEEVVQAQRDVAARLDANVRWHLAIGEASHNEIIAAFMTAISQAIRDSTSVETLNEEISGSSTGMIMAHERVMQAIEAQDGDAARRAMQKHLVAFREAAEAHEHPMEIRFDAGELGVSRISE